MPGAKPHLQLIRPERNERWTRGSVRLGGRWICQTLELPWRDNQRRVSCIPPGVYQCRWRDGLTVEIADVPGRSGILIHPGNRLDETKGCILPGMVWLPHGVVMDSIVAVRTLFDVTNGKPFELEVKDESIPLPVTTPGCEIAG